MPSIPNPRQTVLITSRGTAEVMGKPTTKDNIITIDWHMPTSFDPPLYAISIGKERFSHKIISESKAFIVNFMPFKMKERVLYCGRHSGEHIDKFRESKLTKTDADNLDCPRIKEAVAYIECEVTEEIDTGDHTIFIGKVVHSEEVKAEPRIFHTDGDDFTTTK